MRASGKKSIGPVDLVAAEQSREGEFGNRVARWLSEGGLNIPAEQAERLRAARVRAVMKRKVAPTRPASGAKDRFILWKPLNARGLRIASIAPVGVLLLGLWIIEQVQSDRVVSEKAEVDLKLLTDKLPLAAFTEPGFAEFIKKKQQTVASKEGDA